MVELHTLLNMLKIVAVDMYNTKPTYLLIDDLIISYKITTSSKQDFSLPRRQSINKRFLILFRIFHDGF